MATRVAAEFEGGPAGVSPEEIRIAADCAYSAQHSQASQQARHLLGIPQATAAARRACRGDGDPEALVAEALYLVVATRSYSRWGAVRQSLRWAAHRMASMGHVFSLGREAEFAEMGRLLSILRRAGLEDATDEEITEYVTSLPPGRRWNATRVQPALETLRSSRITLASELLNPESVCEYHELPGCRPLFASEAKPA